MATRASTEPAPAAAIEADGGGSIATVAPLRIPKAVDHAPAVAQPGELRARMLRRLLLAGDIVALCAAFFLVQLSAGDLAPHNLALLVLSLPLWLLLAYGHRLYHLDSYRADYSAADEIGPVLQMATLWSWTVLSPWRW